MASWIVVLTALSIFTSSSDSSSCQDIDTNACILLAAQKPDFCADAIVSSRTCPRYCKQCPLECYQCNTTVADFHMCKTTTMCAHGQVCMRKKLTSSEDGHVEYELTCENAQACDGLGLVIGFGKRSIESRDLSVSCCDKDRCNYPAEITTPMVLTAAPTATPTTLMSQGCKKDVIIIVDEFRKRVHSTSAIIAFLRDVFSSLAIGQSDVLMSLSTFATKVKLHWNLNTHTDKSDLMTALSGVSLHGENGDLNVAIQYAIGQVNTNSANGNRPDAPDVVIIITDDDGRNTVQELTLDSQLHRQTDNVIAIGIGTHVTSAELARLATDGYHGFYLKTVDSLSTMASRVAQLICPKYAGCKKDVIVIVDESRGLVHYSSVINDFLRDVFSSFAIGKNDVLMSLATFTTSVKPHWDLTTHTDKSDLVTALSGVSLNGGTGDLNVAIRYAIGQVSNNSANGNRPDAADVVIIITDDDGRSVFQEYTLDSQLHRKTDNVIAIGIGTHVTSSELLRLATDGHHGFHLRTAAVLSQLASGVAQLICP